MDVQKLLDSLLKASSWKERQRAAELLIQMRDKRATELLIIAFLEGQWPVPKAVAVALGAIDPQWHQHQLVRAAVPELIARLGAERWYDRQRAAWALGRVQAAVELTNAVTDPPDVQRIRSSHQDSRGHLGSSRKQETGS